MNVDDFLRRAIAGTKPPTYPGNDAGFLRMDANTNLIGPNPAARGMELNHYPSAVSAELVSALEKKHGAPVIVGDGSDEVIDFITKAFVNPGDVIAIPTPTFVMYAFYARINLARVLEVPLGPDFALDADALLRTKAKIYFVASPNNPTGNRFDDLERLVRLAPGIVVIDEAYADFCGQDYASRVNEFDNLIVLRTFSKSYGLAGLRVGYAVGRKELIEKLYCVKPPFDVGTLNEAIALEALGHEGFVRDTIQVVQLERARLAKELEALGFRACRSDANFMLVEVGRGREAREFLHGRRILTRDLGDFPGLERYLRVTVGRPEHNDRLVGALKEWRQASR